MPPKDSGPEGRQILPFHREEKQGSEQLSDLPRVTQLASSRSRTSRPHAIPGFMSFATIPSIKGYDTSGSGLPGRELGQGSQKSCQLSWRPASRTLVHNRTGLGFSQQSEPESVDQGCHGRRHPGIGSLQKFSPLPPPVSGVAPLSEDGFGICRQRMCFQRSAHWSTVRLDTWLLLPIAV